MTAPARPRPLARVDSRWLFVALTAIFINTSYGALSYAFPVFVTKAGPGGTFGEGTVSFGFGLALLVSGFAALGSGTIADLFGTRRVLAAGALIGAAGLVLLSLCQAAWQFIAVMGLVIGPAMAATFYEPVYVLMNRWFEAHERPRAYGVLTLLSGTSITVFTPLTHALIAGVGWREAMVALAIILACIGIVVPAAIREPNLPVHEHRLHPLTIFRSAREGIQQTTRLFWLFTGALFVGIVAFSGYQFHLVAQLESRGFGAAAVATAVGLSGIASLPARLVLPAWAGRRPSAAILAGCLIGLAIAAWLASAANGWWEVWLVVALFGLSFGAVYPLRTLVLSEHFAGPYFGRIISIQALIIAIAYALGPVVVSAFGTGAAAYERAFRVAAITLVIAGSACWYVMRRRP